MMSVIYQKGTVDSILDIMFDVEKTVGRHHNNKQMGKICEIVSDEVESIVRIRRMYSV